MKRIFLIILTLLTFGIGNAIAKSPCVELKANPDEFKKWKVVETLQKSRYVFIKTVVNPDPSAEIKAVIYIIGPFQETDANGKASIKFDVIRFCYLDKGMVKDFFYCVNCKCWHKADVSPEVAMNLRMRLLKALDGKTS